MPLASRARWPRAHRRSSSPCTVPWARRIARFRTAAGWPPPGSSPPCRTRTAPRPSYRRPGASCTPWGRAPPASGEAAVHLHQLAEVRLLLMTLPVRLARAHPRLGRRPLPAPQCLRAHLQRVITRQVLRRQRRSEVPAPLGATRQHRLPKFRAIPAVGGPARRARAATPQPRSPGSETTAACPHRNSIPTSDSRCHSTKCQLPLTQSRPSHVRAATSKALYEGTLLMCFST